MANSKISALTAATTPVAGTETLPIVQSGVTKQVSIANLTAGRAVSAASLSLTTPLTVGNGGTGTGTAFTAGSVIFAGASGVYSQNNAKFFWDNTNALLGLGTNAPGYILHVEGTSYFNATKSNSALVNCNFIGSGGYWGIRTNTSNDFCLDRYYGGSLNSLVVKNDTGDLEMASGNIVPKTAAKGINFTANTPASGMTSQLLNWYEEGTWTLGLTTAGGNFTSISVNAQTCKFTRVGRTVIVSGAFYTSGTVSGGSGQVYITGLPYSGSDNAIGRVWVNPDTANYGSPSALPTGGIVSGTQFRLFKNGTTNNPAFNSTDLATSGNANNIYFTVSYQV